MKSDTNPNITEGETPETDAASAEFDRMYCDGSARCPPTGQFVLKSFARSLEHKTP